MSATGWSSIPMIDSSSGTRIPRRRACRSAPAATSSEWAWIAAFRDDLQSTNLFTPTGRWIGWVAWEERDVCSAAGGEYLATLVGDRLPRKIDAPPRFTLFTRFAPFAPLIPPAPEQTGAIDLPNGYEDLSLI